jgi:tetratricopeptide (TPR) repeat protein
MIPTVLMGFMFPIAVEACTRLGGKLTRQVGNVYAWNTIGCVVGSFAAGFVLAPLMGLRNSFLLVVTVQVVLGLVVVFLSGRVRRSVAVSIAVVLIAVVVGHILFLPADVFLRTLNTYHHPSEIVYIKDDVTGTVTVHDLPDGDRLIAVDGVNVAGMDLMLRTTQKLQGYIPLLIHENPEKVVQVGFGSGETSGVGLAFGVPDYRIVEVCPGVFEAGRYFEEINRGSYKDPRLTRVIMDGKNFLKLTDEKFDVIMNDSTYPGTTGSSALYTYDHFKQCRDRLRPGGVQSCWLPLDLRPEDLSIILRSFQKAMPNCSLWMASNCLNKHAVLVGTMSEMRIDFQRAKVVLERPEISEDLAGINLRSVYDVLDCFIVDGRGLSRMAGAGPVNTDDMPSLEFGAAIKRDDDSCLMVALEGLARHHQPVSGHLTNLGDSDVEIKKVRATLDRYYAGTGHVLGGLLGILQGDPGIMKQQFEMAVKVNPLGRGVQSCMEELRMETDALSAAVERTPGDATLRSRLAKRYMLLEDYEHASVHYEAFVQLEPGNAAGWNNLGICHNKLGQYSDAVVAFQEALEADSRMFSAFFNLGQAYLNLGDYAASARVFEGMVKSCPPGQRVMVYDRLAGAYAHMGRFDRAVSAIDAALELVPAGSPAAEQMHNKRESLSQANQAMQP